MIDTHCHLTCDELYVDICNILQRAKDANVEAIFNIATDEKSLYRGLEIANSYSWIRNIAAATPHDVDTIGDDFFLIVEKMAKEKRLIGIGETGLDYHYEYSNRITQKKHLRKYIELAIDTNLPLIIHCREAFDDLIQILGEYPDQKKILLHCFTGTLTEALRLVDMGVYISFSGIVTYKKSIDLQTTCKSIPKELIVVETDAPYLAPQSKRGKKNEPAYIKETVEKIAEIHQLPVDEIIKITSNNAKKLFRIC